MARNGLLWMHTQECQISRHTACNSAVFAQEAAVEKLKVKRQNNAICSERSHFLDQSGGTQDVYVITMTRYLGVTTCLETRWHAQRYSYISQRADENRRFSEKVRHGFNCNEHGCLFELSYFTQRRTAISKVSVTLTFVS